MNKKIILFISSALVLFASNSFAQSLEAITQKYESFQFSTVIQLVNNKLISDTTLTTSQKISLNKMKAISFYSLSKLDSARSTFINLLYLDKDVSFDPIQTSPKIIDYFNSVKAVFKNIVETDEPENGENDIDGDQANIQIFDGDLFANSMYRSLLLPGLGHLSAGSEEKGWLLTTVGAANLGTMIYYIFDTNSKEKDYLNETDLSRISSKYDQYNSSYKVRNILIGTFTAIWLYSQIDLLLNKDDFFVKNISPSLSVSKNSFGKSYNLSLSINF